MNRPDEHKIKEVNESEPEIKLEDAKVFIRGFLKLSRKRQIDFLRSSMEPNALQLISELVQNSLEFKSLSPRAVSPRSVSPRPINEINKESKSGLDETKPVTAVVKSILPWKRDLDPICSLQDLIRSEERLAMIQSNLAESAVEEIVDPDDLERPKSRQRILL